MNNYTNNNFSEICSELKIRLSQIYRYPYRNFKHLALLGEALYRKCEALCCSYCSCHWRQKVPVLLL